MKTSKQTLSSTLKIIAAAALALAALTGPAQASTPNDAWITTKAKLNLLTTDGVNASEVNVDTVDRQITLHGTVNSSAEKLKAEESVRSVSGVSRVRNLLQVVAPAREAAVERADAEVSTAVDAALTRQTALADSSISVQSVNKGVVLLSGKAADLTDQLTAVQTARAVPGVRRVASEIQSADQLADSRIWSEAGSADRNAASEPTASERIETTARDTKEAVKESAHDAKEAVQGAAHSTGDAVADAAKTTTDAASDLYVTSMVKMRLLADKETPAMDINVDTEDGSVTLFGIVPSATAKAQAESEARKVSGVSDVHNQLQVVAEASKPAVEAMDEEVETSVEAKLKQRETLKDVSIDVKNCIVRLTGTVPSGDEKVEAMQVARAARGVCAVQNDLRIQ